ncbi:MAG: hypothetical protein ISS53_05445 [Dehalococcoidia bacterium]|nr:hypothetical protein [Dehalococcoidia bacterium]
MRHHLENGDGNPICKKCGKPMKLETCFKGIGVKQAWFCTQCKTRKRYSS